MIVCENGTHDEWFIVNVTLHNMNILRFTWLCSMRAESMHDFWRINYYSIDNTGKYILYMSFIQTRD